MFRQYADHRHGESVDSDRLVEDVGIAAEASLPKAVADDGDDVFPGLVIFLSKVAAQNRFYAGDVEEIRGDGEALHSFRLIVAADVRGEPDIEREVFERLSLRAPVEIIGHRD